MAKVIVVGAGLAGLCAAVRLADAGCEVELLEARDEIGGRTRSRLIDGTVIELGGQFLSRPHRRMRELVANAGLHLERTRLWSGAARLRRENAIDGRVTSVGVLRDLRAFIRMTLGSNSLAAVRAAAGDDHGAAQQDARSVREWLDGIGLSGPLRPATETLLGETFGGADPGEMSLLAFAELIGGEGNGFLFLLDGFGLTDFIVEGAGALSAHLADRLPPVLLDSAVVSVDHDIDCVAVRTARNEVFEGDHVVLAVPAPILDMIEFAPDLPAWIRNANRALRYGQATKVAAVVPRRDDSTNSGGPCHISPARCTLRDPSEAPDHALWKVRWKAARPQLRRFLQWFERSSTPGGRIGNEGCAEQFEPGAPSGPLVPKPVAETRQFRRPRSRPSTVALCIPCRYHCAMSKQIAVRLPEEVVDFIDREVDQRHVESRASFVLKALERERRRLIAARDAAILAERTTADDDFDALAAHASTFELDID